MTRCRFRRLPLLVLALGLAACGGRPPGQAPAAAQNAASAESAEERVVNVYSWLDYIAPDTVPNFEKETGIKVRFDMYDNNEVLETKLLTGHSNYDVVLPTGAFFERQRLAGIYRKLDKSALPNLANADPDIMRRLAVHDPGNQYAIPYMFTSTGIGYNVDQVRARLGAAIPDGWALLFDPANAAKLKDCGIAIVDSEMDVFQSAMLALGRDPNRFDPADVAAASEALQKIRPFIRYIDPAQYIPDLANNSICVVLAWSGDIEQARSRAGEAKTGVNIVYLVPREGAVMTVDMMAIPADAPHPRNAANLDELPDAPRRHGVDHELHSLPQRLHRLLAPGSAVDPERRSHLSQQSDPREAHQPEGRAPGLFAPGDPRMDALSHGKLSSWIAGAGGVGAPLRARLLPADSFSPGNFLDCASENRPFPQRRGA